MTTERRDYWSTTPREYCEMVIIEDGNFNYSWECSKCKTEHKDTRKFLKSEVCPSCDAVIRNWVGLDDYDD